MTYFRERNPRLGLIPPIRSSIDLNIYILTVTFILFSCAPVSVQGNPPNGFIFWLTNIPSVDEENNSGYARVDGRIYCTDAFYLWSFGAFAYNHTQCPNGAPLINNAELDGYLEEYAAEAFAESYDQSTDRQVLDTVVSTGIWCGDYFTGPFTVPWQLEISYENCSAPPSGPAGGCNGPPYTNGACALGFVNIGGTCTRSLAFQNNCDELGGYDDFACGCNGSCEQGGSCSPIVVDILGNGFDLTGPANGVNFDVDSNGTSELRSWTSNSTDDAWLVLDRNRNGVIDDGKELFGNITAQEPPLAGQEMNGFRALALFDGPGYGGNGDGKVTRNDAIFSRLRLWQDANHNGVSEPNELHKLRDLGLSKIDLNYKESRRVDQHGNQFKYRSRVRDAQDAHLGRWAWDVWLVQP